MPESRGRTERKAGWNNSLRTAFLIYGLMVIGLLGFFIIFPDMKNQGTQGGGTPIQSVAKAMRYEAVVANWKQYRAREARAEMR